MMLAYVVLLLLEAVTTFNRGFFSLPAFIILVCLYGSMFLLFLKKDKLTRISLAEKDSLVLLRFLFILTFVLFLFFSGGIYQTALAPSIFLMILPLLSLPLVLTYTIDSSQLPAKSKMLRFLFLLGAAFSVRVFTILSSPQPTIDVYTILKEAPLTLLQGKNPYDTTFSPVYSGVVSDYYSYWPISFLVQIPFILIFADPRVLLVVADFTNALLIYLLGKKSASAQLLSLIYLFRPNSNFIIEQSWLAPLLFFFVASLFYLIKKKKEILSGILIGFLAGTQLHFLTTLPFFLFLVKRKLTMVSVALFTLLSVVLPFFLWNKSSFLSDTIGFYLRPASQMLTIPVYWSLNLNTFFYTLTGRGLPRVVLGGIIGVIFGWLLVNIRHRSKPQDVALALALFFLTFYFFLPLAFIDHYYLVTDLVILWLVLAKKDGVGRK